MDEILRELDELHLFAHGIEFALGYDRDCKTIYRDTMSGTHMALSLKVDAIRILVKRFQENHNLTSEKQP